MTAKHILLATADIQTAVDVSQALGADWTTTCVTSEAEALARLEAGSFAAFLVDFNLGSPDASELLNQALGKCPDVTRFLFACEADLALVAAKVLGDHEILPKPIEAASLKSRIERGVGDLDPVPTAEDQTQNASALEDDISHVYEEVLQALDSSTVTCRQIGGIIARDASLTQELLRLTHSTYLGLPGNITNPVEAVEVLGLETVKALVMARRFLAEHAHLNACYLSLDTIWQHSINVAQIARDLVLFETRNRALASQALAAGLLHDLGKIVLAANFDDLYGRVHSLARKQPVALWEIEKEMFGASHGEIGGCLVGMWNMSGEVVDAAAFHHEPPLGEHDQLTPLAAVHIANVLEHQRQPKDEFRVLPAVSTPYLNQLRLLQRLPIWRATFSKPLSPMGGAEADGPTPDSPAMEAALNLSPAGADAGTVTATRSARPAPLVEMSATTSSATHPSPKGLFYASLGVALMLLLGVAIQRGSNSSEPAHIQARTLAEPAALVVDTLPPSVQAAPESSAGVTPIAVEMPSQPEAEVAAVAEASVSQPVTEPAPAPMPAEVAGDSAPVSLPTPEPEPAVESTVPPAVATLESPKPSEPVQPAFKLNGIFYSSMDPAAIVNGKSVRVGETVSGATVVRINRGDVILEIDGERKTLSLPAIR